MKKIIYIVILVSFFKIGFLFSQNNVQSYSKFKKWFGLFVESGPSFIDGDTKTKSVGFTFNLGSEYYFGLVPSTFMGIKFIGSTNYLRGQNSNALYFSPNFKTVVFNAKLGLIFGLDLNSVVPYFGGGLSSDLYYNVSFNQNSQIIKSSRPTIGFFVEGGFKIPLSDAISLNLAVNFNNTNNDLLDGFVSGKSKDNYYSFLLGFSFNLAGKLDSDEDGVTDDIDRCPDTPKRVKVDEFGCPLDSDSDGVPDFLDNCSNTPKGAKVDELGCPLDSDGDGVPDYLDKCSNTAKGITIDKNGCPVVANDSDKDGVLDSLDKCKDTPKDIIVDKNGCPIDKDEDGVPDYLDKCSDTPKGTKVDKDGCEIKEIKALNPPKEQVMYVIQELRLFNKGKFTLTAKGKEELQTIAKVMKSFINISWRIEGHTDDTGSANGNIKSSGERANIISKYLVSLGVRKDLLTAEGMGRKFPIVPNTSDENRLKNRRIVIVKTN